MKDFRRLKVWEKSHLLVMQVYRLSSRFPRSEMFGLVGQMRRASVSIASSLAEGCGRGSDAELGRFAEIAMGSASELEYQILLAKDLGYLAGEDSVLVADDVVEIKRMLAGLIGRLGNSRRQNAASVSVAR